MVIIIVSFMFLLTMFILGFFFVFYMYNIGKNKNPKKEEINEEEIKFNKERDEMLEKLKNKK